jgi:hypothetical protein
MVPLPLEAADITEVFGFAQRPAFCSNFQRREKNTVGTTGLAALPARFAGAILWAVCGQENILFLTSTTAP